MVWKKLNSAVEMLEKPCLGNVKPIEGKRFMALCVEPGSKQSYRGIVRQVIDREGSADVSGFFDISKLVIVKSKDLLNWEVVGDFKIKEIEDVIEKFQRDETRFLGLEDPDIVVDEKGILHVYFTIAYGYLDKKESEVYLGHAFGKDLNNLRATNPLLGPTEEYIWGFKELAPSFVKSDEVHLHLVEGGMQKENKGISVIATVRATEWGKNWEYNDVTLHPKQQKYDWCSGEASPCRILSRKMIRLDGDLFVLIINGREPSVFKNGKKFYGKFRPGLALYNPKTGEIPWIAPEPLFEDPDATTITFASEVVPFDKEHFLLYAHVNDSFVRAYRIKYEEIRKILSG